MQASFSTDGKYFLGGVSTSVETDVKKVCLMGGGPDRLYAIAGGVTMSRALKSEYEGIRSRLRPMDDARLDSDVLCRIFEPSSLKQRLLVLGMSASKRDVLDEEFSWIMSIPQRLFVDVSKDKYELL